MIDDVTNNIFSANQTPNASVDAGGDEPDDLEQELQTRFELLPDDLKEVIMGTDYPTVLFDVAKNNGLQYDDLETIELGTMMVLLGITHPEELRDELKIQLGRDDAQIDAIIKEIDEKIFSQVADSLKKLYASTYNEEEEDAEDIAIKQEIADLQKDINQPASTPSIPTPVTPALNPVPTREELMDGIENPVKTPINTPQTVAPTPNIVASKLTMSSTTIPNKNTDYTIPKGNTNGAGGVDPYREMPL